MVAQYRAHPEDLLKLNVRSADGKMIPIGALAQLKPAQGAAIISLYNLYPSAAVVGSPMTTKIAPPRSNAA